MRHVPPLGYERRKTEEAKLWAFSVSNWGAGTAYCRCEEGPTNLTILETFITIAFIAL